MASLAEQRRAERRASNKAAQAALAEKHRASTPAERAEAKRRKLEAEEQAHLEAAARAASERRRAIEEAAARRAWPGTAEAPHPHNPHNRPPSWRHIRARHRQFARDSTLKGGSERRRQRARRALRFSLKGA